MQRRSPIRGTQRDIRQRVMRKQVQLDPNIWSKMRRGTKQEEKERGKIYINHNKSGTMSSCGGESSEAAASVRCFNSHCAKSKYNMLLSNESTSPTDDKNNYNYTVKHQKQLYLYSTFTIKKHIASQ